MAGEVKPVNSMGQSTSTFGVEDLDKIIKSINSGGENYTQVPVWGGSNVSLDRINSLFGNPEDENEELTKQLQALQAQLGGGKASGSGTASGPAPTINPNFQTVAPRFDETNLIDRQLGVDNPGLLNTPMWQAMQGTPENRFAAGHFLEMRPTGTVIGGNGDGTYNYAQQYSGIDPFNPDRGKSYFGDAPISVEAFYQSLSPQVQSGLTEQDMTNIRGHYGSGIDPASAMGIAENAARISAKAQDPREAWPVWDADSGIFRNPITGLPHGG